LKLQITDSNYIVSISCPEIPAEFMRGGPYHQQGTPISRLRNPLPVKRNYFSTKTNSNPKFKNLVTHLLHIFNKAAPPD